MTGLYDVEFSLAIYNRTGKYFIGKDIIDSCGDLIGDIWYGASKGKVPPPGIVGKVVGRLQHIQVLQNALGGPLSWLPRRTPPRPLLHIDPFSVLSTRLRPEDLVICHDVGPVTDPELFDPKNSPVYDAIYRHIAEIGPHIVFVSEATKVAFNRLYPHARCASQTVIYPTIKPAKEDGAIEAVTGIDGPYLLTVGALGTRKNQIRSMRAFQRSGLAAQGVRYVLCGSREPGYDAVCAEAERTEGVIRLSYVSDAQLTWLYRNARGFVLPSLLEGFGMPVAEAIGHGLVPLVSKDSVLEEVAGEGALTVDPLDGDDIASGMTALVVMGADERAQRVQLLQQSIRRFDGAVISSQWRDALKAMSGQAQA
ncbi:MAG: glycosyltransferase family 1 protein [Asticcacaulis sp.]